MGRSNEHFIHADLEKRIGVLLLLAPAMKIIKETMKRSLTFAALADASAIILSAR